MVKALLLESQFPVGASTSPFRKSLVIGSHSLCTSVFVASIPLEDGRFPMWIDKGMNEAPKSSYYELCLQNVGLPTGGDPYGNGASIVV
jgi:hypothetical protein